MNVHSLLSGLLLLVVASAAVADAPAVDAGCRPRVEAAWVRAAPPGAAMLAGYARIANPCAKEVVVVGAESLDFGSVSVHRTVEEGGVSRMRAAGPLAIAPGQALILAPGGLHLMLMRPLRPLAEGGKARIRLVLADGRRVYAEYPVRRQAPGG